MPDQQQWEYRIISIGTFWTEPKPEELENTLNELGLDGWEVITVIARYGSSKVGVIAKRPLTANGRRKRSWPAG